MDDLSGKVIKGYELRELIGKGGFGAVYRAYQPVVNRDVAIKIIRPEYANHPEFIRRFETEAQLIARLEHLHIVPLYDYWREPYGAYLVMRWLRGGNLREMLKRGACEAARAVRLVEQIAAALNTAHRNGVVHQDVKPENILLDEDGNAYLTDFGIARHVVGGGQRQAASDEGQLYGSPPYMSPEAILLEPITPQSDIYSLGIVLYELLTGRVPFPGPDMNKVMKQQVMDPVPPLQFVCPGLPTALNAVVWRATAKSPDERYADALKLAGGIRDLALQDGGAAPAAIAQTPSTSPFRRTPPGIDTLSIDALAEPMNPFKGLHAFEEADADRFFGREELVARLVARLAEPANVSKFLAVVGPSGSGKSSVVSAGLVPALRQGCVPGSTLWFVVRMFPGDDPFGALERALLRVATHAPPDLPQRLREERHGLHEIVEQILPRSDFDLLLVIDQFEEIFTLVSGEAERARFLNHLHAAVVAPGGRLRVVVTLRADFYDRPLLYPGFGDLVRARTEVVLPLTPDALVRAIARPAEQAGITVEKNLLAAIINDVSEQPGMLPLLQYALTELFEQRELNALTLDAYRASGGVAGALATRADDLYISLDAGGQQATRQLFLRLIAVDQGSEDTRRRVPWAELTSIAGNGAMQEVIDRFGQYRLLTFDRDPQTREPTVEVAHEALIREWGLLRRWLDESREDLLMHRRLTAATGEWVNAGRDSSYLALGTRLEQFESVGGSTSLALNEDEAAYLAASTALRLRNVNRRRLLMAALVLFSIVALALAAIALVERDRADLEARTAHSRELAMSALVNLDQLDVALMLSLEALDAADTLEARRSLFTALQETDPHLETFLRGHDYGVHSVAFSPDGEMLASGGIDGDLILWDVRTRRMIGQPRTGRQSRIDQVAFSPGGEALVSAGGGEVVLWDVDGRGVDASVTVAYEWRVSGVQSVAFNPDGGRLVSGSMDGTVAVWDAATGAQLEGPRTKYPDRVYSVVFSPDGRLIAAGGDDNTIWRWDAETGEQVGEPLAAHENWVRQLAFSPDGARLASGGEDGMVVLWDLATGEHDVLAHGGRVRGVAFSPDGALLVSGSGDETVMLWDVETLEPLGAPLTGHSDGVWQVVFSPAGDLMASAGDDHRVILWNLEPHRLQWKLDTYASRVSRVAFSPQRALLASANYDTDLLLNNVVRLRDVSPGGLAAEVKIDFPVTGLAFAPGGGRLAVADVRGQVALWSISDAGGTIACEREQVVSLGGRNPAVNSVAFSPDGTLLASGDDGGNIALWDTETWGLRREPFVAGEDIGVSSVAFSPDGSVLAAGVRNGTVALWDVRTGKPAGAVLDEHSQEVTSVAFSPDGRLLASGGRDAVVVLWDTGAWQPVARLVEHPAYVTDLAFSPDGKMLGTTDINGDIVLWMVDEFGAIGWLTGHTDWVSSVAFSPDSTRLASGGMDRTVMLWDVGWESWLAHARRIANDAPR